MTRDPHDSARFDLAAEVVATWLRLAFPQHVIRRRWRLLGERWLFQFLPIDYADAAHELQIDVRAFSALGPALVDALMRAGVEGQLRDHPNVAYQFQLLDGLSRLWSMYAGTAALRSVREPRGRRPA